MKILEKNKFGEEEEYYFWLGMVLGFMVDKVLEQELVKTGIRSVIGYQIA